MLDYHYILPYVLSVQRRVQFGLNWTYTSSETLKEDQDLVLVYHTVSSNSVCKSWTQEIRLCDWTYASPGHQGASVMWCMSLPFSKLLYIHLHSFPAFIVASMQITLFIMSNNLLKIIKKLIIPSHPSNFLICSSGQNCKALATDSLRNCAAHWALWGRLEGEKR